MVCVYLEGLLHLRCVRTVAFHNLSAPVMGAGLTQNEEISVIARPFIIVVLAHGLLGVKASGF